MKISQIMKNRIIGTFMIGIALLLLIKTKFTKAKVTRILDKFEGRGLIERRKYGMTNVVILKH